jgi:hypothetical protein
MLALLSVLAAPKTPCANVLTETGTPTFLLTHVAITETDQDYSAACLETYFTVARESPVITINVASDSNLVYAIPYWNLTSPSYPGSLTFTPSTLKDSVSLTLSFQQGVVLPALILDNGTQVIAAGDLWQVAEITIKGTAAIVAAPSAASKPVLRTCQVSLANVNHDDDDGVYKPFFDLEVFVNVSDGGKSPFKSDSYYGSLGDFTDADRQPTAGTEVLS